MAVTLESFTEDPKDMEDALIAGGLTIVEEPKPETKEEPKPEEKEEKKPSANLEETKAEKPKVEPGDKTAPDSETGEPKSQEQPSGEKEKKVETAPPAKPKGGFQARIDRLTADKERLREEVDQERGDKTKLRDQLAQVQSQLDALKPQTETKPDEPQRPKRPELPELSDFQYDADKFQAAMKEYRAAVAKYDEDLDVYRDKVTERTTAKAIADEREARKKADEERDAQQALSAYYERLNQDKAAYEDFAELFEALPKGKKTILDNSTTVINYISGKSQHPAHLVHYFLDDYHNNGEAEGKRIAALDDFDQAYEIKAIEDRLIREAGKATKAAKAAAVAEPEPEPEPEPAKPETAPAPQKQRAKTPDAPITPVGGRAAQRGDSFEAMAERGDGAAIRKKLEAGWLEKQQQRGRRV